MKKLFLLFFLLISVITACSRGDVPNSPEETPPSVMPAVNSTQTKPEEESTQMSQPTPPPGMEHLVNQAKEDLAQRLSIPVDQIELLRAESVTWPDASLGCPQPGMVYADVLTPGYVILLEANNQEYEYHASRGTEIVYCENPNPPIPGTPEDI